MTCLISSEPVPKAAAEVVRGQGFHSMNRFACMGGRVAAFRTNSASVPIPSEGFCNLETSLTSPPVWSSNHGHPYAAEENLNHRWTQLDTDRELAVAALQCSARFQLRVSPQPKRIAAKERKERRDGNPFCVPCIPSRQVLRLSSFSTWNFLSRRSLGQGGSTPRPVNLSRRNSVKTEAER